MGAKLPPLYQSKVTLASYEEEIEAEAVEEIQKKRN
jgi:hypothetical protein